MSKDNETKRCISCGETRPIDYFALDDNSPDGHIAECVACDSPKIWAQAQDIKSKFSSSEKEESRKQPGLFSTIRGIWARVRVVSAANRAAEELKDMPPGPEKMERTQKRIAELLKIDKE